MTRADLERVAGPLVEPEGGDRRFLVQTYARDLGTVLTLLSVPVYVKGYRWGTSVLAWNDESSG